MITCSCCCPTPLSQLSFQPLLSALLYSFLFFVVIIAVVLVLLRLAQGFIYNLNYQAINPNRHEVGGGGRAPHPQGFLASSY